MTPALFGYFGSVPAHDVRESGQLRPYVGATEELCRFSDFIAYGRRADIGIAQSLDSEIIVLVLGTPTWAGKTVNTQVAAQHLLVAFKELGSQTISRLGNGFAVVLIDRARHEAHLSIDRIGRVPLAYASSSGNSLYFSTDARVVANAVSDNPRLNKQAIYDYSFFHAVPSAETIFSNVSKLPPACTLRWRSGTQNLTHYWQPTFNTKTDKSIESLGGEFLASLENGVRASEPDQHTASFLSGGIDSSTVTGLLARILGTGRPAYTIGFEQAGYDETEYARTAAKHFGADLRVHYITTKEVEHCVPELAAIYDEPFGNSSAVPALVCSRLARADGITHMLAGDGGDELFAGNARYAKQRIFEAYNHVPNFAKSIAEKFFLSATVSKTPLRKIGSYINQARIPLPDRLESYNFLLRENVATMFEPDFLSQVNTDHPFELLRKQYFQPQKAATLDRMLYLDWKFTLADNDLRKVNTTCQHAGVKVSFPWLDDGVIEFSTTLPPRLKMHGTKLRYFAKRALTGFLPQETITKSKHGFGLPFGQWLKTSPELQTQIYDLLNALGRRGIFQEQFIRHLIAEHRDGHAAYYGTMVWVLAMLEGWLQANKSASF